MKSLFKTIAVIGLFSIATVSCEKATTSPANASNADSKTVETNLNSKVIDGSKVLTGNIIALSSDIKLKRSGEILYTTFDNLTASTYPGTLYVHFSTSSTGPWSNGVLPYSWVSPDALYSVSPAYSVGTTVYLFYSTNTGTSYPSGSASPIYSSVVSL
jgi:hypothetical protein